MHSRRIVPTALAVLALTAPAAEAKFTEYPGPQDQSVKAADQAMQMRVRRDAGAPNPPAALPARPQPSDASWTEIGVLAAFGAGLVGAGATVARRRRAAATAR